MPLGFRAALIETDACVIVDMSEQMSEKLNTNVESRSRIREIRKALGYTQAEMAEALELNRSYLSQLESGKMPIRSWVLDKCINVLWGLGPGRGLDVPSIMANMGILVGTEVRKTGSTYHLPWPGRPEDVLSSFVDNTTKWTSDELLAGVDFIAQTRGQSPAVMSELLQSVSTVLQNEIRRRLGESQKGVSSPKS